MLDERGTGIPNGRKNQIMLLNCLDLQSEVGLAVSWTWSGWNTSVSDSGWHCREKKCQRGPNGMLEKKLRTKINRGSEFNFEETRIWADFKFRIFINSRAGCLKREKFWSPGNRKIPWKFHRIRWKFNGERSTSKLTAFFGVARSV